MLQPRGPRVLVKRIDAPKPTSSTIIIPETVDGEKSCYAIVLAVGNKITEDIKVADTVILAAYCGSPVQVELDGEMLDAMIVMQDDVLAVVEE
jgi:co-chaperonin GroES (HSP10)